MITNSELTIFHKALDQETRLEKWKRYNYDKAWIFKERNANLNAGYTNNNIVSVRIPYDENKVNIQDFAIGDIIIKGNINMDINTQQDLSKYETYNITSITNNNFGRNQHIHLEGK